MVESIEMICQRSELKTVLHTERAAYTSDSLLVHVKSMLLQDHNYLLWKYVKYLRYTEYHYNAGHRLRYYIWQWKKNRLGARLGITMWHNTADTGLRIWHYGSVIINGNAKVGKNCQLHGENCIGNKGDFDQAAPVIGDNVDIGVGAKIIGGISIADDVKIGANAVVTKSCLEKGAVLVGAPAHVIARGK